MTQRRSREDGQQDGPDAHEEATDEEDDHPGLRVDGAPEVSPVTAIRCGKEEILDEDGDEEP